ncbi:RICIN domain-containing protein [Paraferrimonas sp. SM1919]|uniref:RICIN domain-containing protein n=1 Tax=Paraferrimonas sp. SM1919 TaxID=2662263 RepID=UPI0013D40944|nr:RICIN domain-containing protein [Paraferrimonas sp. SM1919]
MKRISKIEITCALIPVVLGSLVISSFNAKAASHEVSAKSQTVAMKLTQSSDNTFKIYSNEAERCLSPNSYHNGSKVVVSDNCGSNNSDWTRLENGLIKHQGSQYCLAQKQDQYILSRCGRNASQLTSEILMLSLAPLPPHNDVVASK